MGQIEFQACSYSCITEMQLMYGQFYKKLLAVETMKLNNLKPGESAMITEISGEKALRCRLLDMGIIPKTTVTLRKAAPMGDPLEILIRGYILTLRAEDAENITVKKGSCK